MSGTLADGWKAGLSQTADRSGPHVACLIVVDLRWCSGLQELVSPVNKEKGMAPYDSASKVTLFL